MSRSRRKRKLPKCICGRSEVPYQGYTPSRWPRGECPVLGYTHEYNAQYRKFKARRLDPVT